MTMHNRLFGALAVIALLLAARAEAGEAALADLLLSAEAGGRPIPVLSAVAPGLDLATAYGVQRLYVERRLANERIGGFKAALTTSEAQAAFGVSEPLLGVLFASGRREGSPVIALKSLRLPGIEMEMIFAVGEPIDRPLADAWALVAKLRWVAPAIELPELGYGAFGGLTGPDIAAANSSAALYIVGPRWPPDEVDLATVEAALYRDGVLLDSGRAGDPWAAALWTVNMALAQGWTVRPGDLVLAGAMSGPLIATPGAYHADFGALGAIDFSFE